MLQPTEIKCGIGTQSYDYKISWSFPKGRNLVLYVGNRYIEGYYCLENYKTAGILAMLSREGLERLLDWECQLAGGMYNHATAD